MPVVVKIIVVWNCVESVCLFVRISVGCVGFVCPGSVILNTIVLVSTSVVWKVDSPKGSLVVLSIVEKSVLSVELIVVDDSKIEVRCSTEDGLVVIRSGKSVLSSLVLFSVICVISFVIELDKGALNVVSSLVLVGSLVLCESVDKSCVDVNRLVDKVVVLVVVIVTNINLNIKKTNKIIKYNRFFNYYLCNNNQYANNELIYVHKYLKLQLLQINHKKPDYCSPI